MKRKKTDYRYDTLHMIDALCIIIFSGLVFWDSERYHYGFPIIFALAALMLGNGGQYRRKCRKQGSADREEEKYLFLLASLFMVLAIVSALTQ